MIDVKKLITGFLAFAVIAAGSGIVLSLLGNAPGVTAPAGPSIAGAPGQGTGSPLLSGSAFVNTGSLQGNAAEVLDAIATTSTASQANDPANLTNVFANSFVDGYVAANPNGVIASGTEGGAFMAPSPASVTQEILANQAVQNITIPNWDVEAQSQLIKTSSSSSPDAISAYATALNAIFNEYFVANNLQTQIQNTANSPLSFGDVESQVQGALNNTLAIKTPSSLVGLQQSLVRVLVYEKNSLALAQSSANDPVKAALILQGEQSKYDAALANLTAQMAKAQSIGLLFGKDAPQSSVPFIAQIFGVRPAYAFLGLGDITFDPAVFGQWVLDFIKTDLLQVVKNALISNIQQKVLKNIQGNGTPKFIQDYAAEIINSYQTASLATLNAELSETPSYQQGALGILLSTPYQSPNAIGRSASQLISPDSNLQNLTSNNFTNFTDYLALFGPGGNVWSNAMTIHDDAMNAGALSEQANQTQNIAEQGWVGTAVCADGSAPDGSRSVCAVGTLIGNACYVNTQQVGTPVSLPNGGRCADGLPPTIISPGQTVGQSMMSVLQAGPQLISNANGVTGIVTALADALISQLAQQGIAAAVNAVPNPGLTGVNPASITAGSSGSASSTAQGTAVQCLPSVQPATLAGAGGATANLSAGGGAIDTSCAINGTCTGSVNSDGTPIYTWSAPGSAEGASGAAITGSSINLTYNATGTFYATVTASTDGTQATCQIDVTN